MDAALKSVSSADTKASAKSWLGLVVLCLAGLAIYVSETSVAVALPDMMGDLGVSLTAIAWVATTYVLMVGVFVPLAPTFGERFGYKKMFLVAFTLFALGSFIAWLSSSYGVLIAGRVVQGIGGCFIGPSLMKIAASIFTGKDLNIALSLVTGSVGAGTALGPALGGYLIETFSWNALFGVNIFIALLIIPLAYLLIDEPGKTSHIKFDIPGTCLIVVASSSLLLALANGNAGWNTDGWSSYFILGSFAVCILSFTFFVLWERHVERPLILLELFKSVNFLLPAICIFVLGFGFLGTQFMFPVYMENYLNFTRLKSGMTFVPSGVGMMVISVIIGRILDKTGAIIPVIIGFLCISISYSFGPYLSLQTDQSYLITMLIFRGLGLGLCISPVINLGVSSFKIEWRGYATSGMLFFYLLGSSCGVAAFETLLIKRTTFHSAILSESAHKASSKYQEVSKGLQTYIRKKGSHQPFYLEAQSDKLIANHLHRVSYVAAVNGVMFVVFWVTLSSTASLAIYEALRRMSSHEKQEI